MKRRDFIKALLVAVAASALPVARLGLEVGAAESNGDSYYVTFDITGDKERIKYYSAFNLVIDIDGKKCVANPLLPDRCITYTKPAWEDRFPIRPPGATRDFDERCIRCGLCYFACNLVGYDAIRLGSLEDGFKLLGTPIVDRMWQYPCTLCMECTKYCPTGALAEISKKDVKMGVAIIDPDLCWAWNSGDCKSCASACPIGSEIFDFTFNEWGVHTRVKPDKCKGCGLCVEACPVVGAAIHVLPLDEFERRRRSYKNTGMSYDEYLKLILETEFRDPVKATLRVNINTDYIQNVRGFVKEKVKTMLETGSKGGSLG